MPAFTDLHGREWSLRLTVADLRPLREMGMDVAALMTSMERVPDILFGDAERLATAVYRLSGCKLPTDEFAAALDGPTLEAAGVALIEACVLFFPLSRTAAAMRGKVREALAAIDERLAQTISSGGAGSSAGSPDSTPAA